MIENCITSIHDQCIYSFNSKTLGGVCNTNYQYFGQTERWRDRPLKYVRQRGGHTGL